MNKERMNWIKKKYYNRKSYEMKKYLMRMKKLMNPKCEENEVSKD